MNDVAHKTRRIFTALALGFSIAAVAVPVAQADAVDRLDPLVADAIRAEQASPDLDPLIADAIRHGQPDFWNYDARTGEKTSNTSPGVRPSDLARLYSPTGDVSPDSRAVDLRAPSPSSTPISAARNGFQWGDAGIGAGAMLALVAMGTIVGTLLVRRRHDLLVSQ